MEENARQEVVSKEQEKLKHSAHSRKKVRRQIDWDEWEELQREEREFKKLRKQKHEKAASAL